MLSIEIGPYDCPYAEVPSKSVETARAVYPPGERQLGGCRPEEGEHRHAPAQHTPGRAREPKRLGKGARRTAGGGPTHHPGTPPRGRDRSGGPEGLSAQ
jgi:hypothetical protein